MKAKKFFAWVHLYDPHTPYEPPEPFRSRYPGQPYLGEVAYTDQVVGRLVAWLKAGGRAGTARSSSCSPTTARASASTARTAHTFFVYDATQHVPLIVRTPWGDRGPQPGPGLAPWT